MNEDIDYQSKFQEESDYIEKEKNFYYFDETLLQNRSLEIDELIKALIDLKQALIFSSTEQKEEKIINYYNSSAIFKYFKNKEAMSLC